MWRAADASRVRLESTGPYSVPAPRRSRSECKCRRRCLPGRRLQHKEGGWTSWPSFLLRVSDQWRGRSSLTAPSSDGTSGVCHLAVIPGDLLIIVHRDPSLSHGFFPPTCEEAAVVLLYFLRRLKLLLGMFLGELLPQVQRVLLFSEHKTSHAPYFQQP